ncbi:proteasome-activating ATPase [Aureococcus anophagefferens]|nr:proteasome-activating ATPase [Aureococcus anophagefferens]
MSQTKILVKVNPEGKYVVDLGKGIDVGKCTPNTRVALRNDSYELHKILPTKVDPLLVQKYIGEGSRMVRELFVMAREAAPSIIFMDEVDSIGSSRGEGGEGGDSRSAGRCSSLNQLDGFEPTQSIKVIMATNRIDILDSALLRPGRIDRKIDRKMNLLRGIDLHKIADKMMNASGAECKGVCSEAGMFALRERRIHVTQEDFEMAVAKVMKKDMEGDAPSALK